MVMDNFFRLTCSVMLWGGRKAGNKYHWCVWGMLPVSWEHWVCPAHGVCAFPVYTAQVFRLLCQELSEVGPGLHALPRSKPSGSGIRVLLKGSDLAGPAFCVQYRKKETHTDDSLLSLLKMSRFHGG